MKVITVLYLGALLVTQPLTPAVTTAIALQKEGKVEQAIAVLRSAVETTPADPVLRNMLGALLNRSGQYGEALTHANAAATLAPDHPRYRLNRGIVLVEHGRFSDAVLDFNFALTHDGTLVYGYLERGSALLSLDKPEDAKAQWALARKTDPNLIWPEWYEGLQDFIEGRHQDAAARFDRVAVAEPGFGAAALWRNLARARAGLPLAATRPAVGAWPEPLDRLIRGEATLDQVLRIAEQDRVTGDPRRVGEALFVAAEIAAVAGRTSEATVLYRRAAAVTAPRHAWKIAAERGLARLIP